MLLNNTLIVNHEKNGLALRRLLLLIDAAGNLSMQRGSKIMWFTLMMRPLNLHTRKGFKVRTAVSME